MQADLDESEGLVNLHTAPEPRDHLEVPRGKIIQLRVTDTELAAMRAAAKKSGLTLSEWVRQCCLTTTTTIEPTVIKSAPRAKKGGR